MTVVRSFPPVVDAQAGILILGSMPGILSLRANQYYAHPQNAFWNIMGELFGARRDLAYEMRLQKLQAQRLGLWDVLKLCTRSGSLDSDIVESSIVVNDFAGLFAQHPHIRQVFFNGAKAEASFRRYALPALDLPQLRFARLPSTSPAHASLRFAEKLEAWRAVAQV